MPLLTGPEAGTNFGVVVGFSEPVAVVAGFVLAALELEDDEELLEDPHPASAATAAQSESVASERRICAATLA